MVAHRPETIASAGRVVGLLDGKIQEIRSPDLQNEQAQLKLA